MMSPWHLLVWFLRLHCSWGFFVLSPRLHSASRQARSNALRHSAVACQSLPDVLYEHGWSERVITLSNDSLPVVAEVQHKGRIQVGLIRKIHRPQQQNDKPPTFHMELFSMGNTSTETNNNATKIVVVDVGQLTTIWIDNTTDQDRESLQWMADWTILEQQQQRQQAFPIRQIDHTLTQIYKECATNSARNRKKYKDNPIQEDNLPVEMAKVLKKRQTLIDSNTLAKSLWGNVMHSTPMEGISSSSSSSSLQIPYLTQRALAAKWLCELGRGRFKRRSCVHLKTNSTSDCGLEGSVTLVNGGWLAISSSVLPTTEAKASAEAGAARGTQSDELIIRKLEHLAMSELRRPNGNNNNNNNTAIDQDLQVDVRAFLDIMNLPRTSHGAKQALLQLGFWVDNNHTLLEQDNIALQPWSSKVLEAVKWYQATDNEQQEKLIQQVQSRFNSNKLNSMAETKLVDGRVDLTHLPSVCVDAKRTTFRDDAVGIRQRSLTGRKVLSPNAKWEILIHITDVSDLYSPERINSCAPLELLHNAAAGRGCSRYDLPGGNIHLLPPSLLRTLALKTVNAKDYAPNVPVDAVNRCVTIWVYIDETSGKLLDAGLERTLISPPVALSFDSASALLSDGVQDNTIPTPIRTTVRTVNRVLQAWNTYQQHNNQEQKKREERLRAREMVDEHIYGVSHRSDDGRDGFRRTVGHRFVDTCLDLYGHTLLHLLDRANACLPHVSGTHHKGGRIATAPLRRYIDGMAQRQALAVLCDYGGKPLTKAECTTVGRRTTEAINAISKATPFKQKTSVSQRQFQAVRTLQWKMSRQSSREFAAMSLGKHSEVVIVGIGAVATCQGIRGTLPPGEKFKVAIQQIDELQGRINARLVE